MIYAHKEGKSSFSTQSILVFTHTAPYRQTKKSLLVNHPTKYTPVTLILASENWKNFVTYPGLSYKYIHASPVPQLALQILLNLNLIM